MDTSTETSNDTKTSIALLQQGFGYVRNDISDMKKTLDNLANQFVTRQQMDAAFTPRDQKYDLFQKELSSLQKELLSQKWWRWIQTAIMMVLTSVVTFLVISFLQHLK